MNVLTSLRTLVSAALLGLFAVLVLSACDANTFTYVAPTPTPARSRPPDLSWNGSVGALFFNKCKSCHGGVAGMFLTSYKDAMKGSMRGPVIVPGDPVNSKLVIKQSTGSHPGQLSDDQLARVKAWIAWGAPEN
ncbi:MAG: hypothetical protein HZB53_05295 [Chloroflexi bacterium]|nr:hypothetical protein [Chloroflexota bacterium]